MPDNTRPDGAKLVSKFTLSQDGNVLEQVTSDPKGKYKESKTIRKIDSNGNLQATATCDGCKVIRVYVKVDDVASKEDDKL